MHCDQGLIVVIVYYFQIWNKKEHNIISRKVITSHMGPMYIETFYTNNISNDSGQRLLRLHYVERAVEAMSRKLIETFPCWTDLCNKIVSSHQWN